MPRRGPVPPREIPPDPIYGDVLVAKLINKVMRHGKKSKAEKIVYGAFDIIKETGIVRGILKFVRKEDIYKAIVLHDVGKAAEIFQKKL